MGKKGMEALSYVGFSLPARFLRDVNMKDRVGGLRLT